MSDFDDVDPLVVITWEAIWGTCIMTTVLIFLQGIPINGQIIENTMSAISELETSKAQIIYTLLMMPLICWINTAGIAVTAYGSAAACCTMLQMRNLFIWLYFMIIPVNGIKLEIFTVL
jgi:hypothetical protein